MRHAQRLCGMLKGYAALSKVMRRSQRLCGVLKGYAARSKVMRCTQRLCGALKGYAAHSKVMWRAQRLYNSRSVTALGKAPSILRNRAATTCLRCQAALTVSTKRCKESVVDWPGCPPKCVFGSRQWVSARYVMSSTTMDESSFAMVFTKVIGW